MKNIKHFFSQENIDNTLSGGISKQIMLLACSTIIVLVMGWLLMFISTETGSERKDLLWHTYLIFADPGCLQETGFNHFLAVIVSLSGSIMLSGILISTISNIMERRVDAIRTGKVTYKNTKNHYVIIGFNEMAISLIKELYQEIKKKQPDNCNPNSNIQILLMSSQETESIIHTLQAQLNKEEEKIIKVYFGNIESEEELKRLNIHLAQEVYIIGEKDEYGRDSKNIGCVHKVSKLRAENATTIPMPVYVQFDRISSYSNIQKFKLQNKKEEKLTNIFFRPFNFYENWARSLWSLYNIDKEDSEGPKSILHYPPLDYRPILINQAGNAEDTHYVHLVIAGFNKMGRALLLEALRICHYANYNDDLPTDQRIRSVITLVDKNMDEMKNYFKAQFPYIESQIDDIKIEYRNDDICSPEMRKDLEIWSKDKQRIMTIAICISEPDMSLSLGLNLPPSIYENEVRVLIRQELHTDLGKLIDEDNEKFKHIRIFGMLNQGIQKNMLQDTLATYINQYYECKYCNNHPKCKAQQKMHCIFSKDNKKKKCYIKQLYELKDKNDILYKNLHECASHSWIKLDEIMRWANRYQLDAYPVYCRALGYNIVKNKSSNSYAFSIKERKEIIKALPILMRMEKHRWNAERSIEGWRYGEKKDSQFQTHPLIMPFSQLIKQNPQEATKDKDVIKNLPYLLALGGFHIEKLT